MPQQGPRRYLLCYDIADPKRLAMVCRRVKRDGVALQYSVFDCQLNAVSLRRLIRDLRELIDDREDDVRIYGPRVDAPFVWLGTAHCTEGVQLFHN